MDDLDTLVRDRFGFPGFRPGQHEIVAHMAAGGDALVVMPTGAGKSLCYQVPALARGGTAIVVSPLIALMKDQVDGLHELGIKATFLNSSLSAAEYRVRSAALQNGEYELAYVAPERFTPAFLDFLKRVDVRLLAIDEAHCLSQWGHDFRPDYLRLGHVRQAMGLPPTIALTATATPEVQKDIVATLRIEKGRTFIRGFDRENLVLEVLEVGAQVEKDALLADLVTPGPALVYCATRKNVERATDALRKAGVRTGMYHAGLAQDDRSRVQDDFMDGKLPVVVATNAFGMGIDKRDIRAIVHYDMPGTVEAYYQEIGRAGRDGRMSRAVLLHHGIDRRIHEFFIDGAHPPAEWVHKMWAWLLSRGDNPVFAKVEDMAAALPPEGADRAASACLSVLIREGRARRIAPNDRSAWLKIEKRPLAPIPGNAGAVWKLVDDRQLEPGDSLDFHVDRWAADASLTREQLTASLARLEERGLLRYRPADRVGGVELFDLGAPLKLDETAMRARRAKAYAKLDKMEGYTGPSCRRRYVVAYFGEVPPFEACGTCDACRMGDALEHEVIRPITPDEATVVLKILSCVARM
ncbi:MAG: RecQ family ATP-dependent DNA helicase, partial [Deltaproteobacteria bacterium]|nr:RecQ family ATP-dependent DNA helicase [Deltaproteobacteria bacterium]